VFARLFSRRPPKAAGVVTERWVENRRRSTRLYSTLPEPRIARLRSRNPDTVDATLAQAARLLRHEFDLLGSGPFVPVDPDRPARDGYRPIDWSLDPVRGLRFPRGIPHREWKLYEMRPANADVKYPWELARCQHWATLGQAYLLVRDEQFARELALQLEDFVEANPVGVGINWTCTMDVALRAVNWAIGLELVQESTTLDSAFWLRAYRALFDHGVFVRNNLENTYEVTSNHFLSNVVGLWFLGAVFADTPVGAEWLAFGRDALEHEIDVQLLADGADFESSVPYHRLVAELFLGASRLADRMGAPLSTAYRRRVRDMVAYLAAVTRPDGLMPQIGDADDGRLHVLGGYGVRTAQDPRHLFGPAGVMFDEPPWRALADREGAWEAEWWGLDWPDDGARAAPVSILFRDAGVAVMRGGDGHYALVTNGIVGTKGFGNHKHNDQLSFEYHHFGVPLVVDPGSFVYTSDFAARNRFRGTASHSTVQIDGLEQNETNPEWIFRMFESSNPEHVRFVESPDAVEYTGRHHGWERLSSPITHERSFTLSKRDGRLTIADCLSGSGDHDVCWRFQLAPEVDATLAGTAVRLAAAGRLWTVCLPDGLQASLRPSHYSPSYGVAEPCLSIHIEARVHFDGARRWEFAIVPDESSRTVGQAG
jgi:heparinase II/III-like protein